MKIDPRLPQLIADNINENADRLRLKYHGNLLMQQAITQIDCRRRCATKLPEALSHSDFMFPSTIAAEQCTSEVIARFHASLIAEGETVVDMTCGLGIDTFAIARRAAAVTAIEIDEAKAECAVHNARVMGLDNVSIVDGDSVAWLNDFTGHVDTIFVDPARRDSMGKRVFGLADCLPDVTALLPRLRQVCDKVIVKASPMLDIKHTIHSLDGAVTHCYVIGTTTECKELVTVLSMTGATTIDDVMIHIVTVGADEVDQDSYRLGDEEKAVPHYASPREGQMLLSPYPAALKGVASRCMPQLIISPRLPLIVIYISLKEKLRDLLPRRWR